MIWTGCRRCSNQDKLALGWKNLEHVLQLLDVTAFGFLPERYEPQNYWHDFPESIKGMYQAPSLVSRPRVIGLLFSFYLPLLGTCRPNHLYLLATWSTNYSKSLLQKYSQRLITSGPVKSFYRMPIVRNVDSSGVHWNFQHDCHFTF